MIKGNISVAGVAISGISIAMILLVAGCLKEVGWDIEEVDEAKTEKLTETQLLVGQTATLGGVSVTVISANRTKMYTYYSDLLGETQVQVAPPGKIYVLVTAEIRNGGSSNILAGSSSFSISDSENYRYDPELYGGDDALDFLKELYPNQRMRGRIVFAMPQNAFGLKIQYDFGDIFTGPRIATWRVT